MADLKDCAGTCIVCIPDCPVQVRQREEMAREAGDGGNEKSQPSKRIPASATIRQREEEE